MSFTAIIIDDEPYALKDLKATVMLARGIEIVGDFPSVPAALVFLRSNGPVHFIFSDIEMPGVSGIDGGEALAEFCDLLVYITGFPSYALDAFKVGGKDYLIKPVTVPEVLKLMNFLSKIKNKTLIPKNQPLEFIEAKAFNEAVSYKIPVEDIHFISSCDNYVEVRTQKKTYVKYSTMKEIEKTLCPGGEFSRINQSTIIAIKAISSVTKQTVTLSTGETFSISRSRKNAFFEIYNGDRY